MLPNVVSLQYPSSSRRRPNGRNPGRAPISHQLTHRETEIVEYRDNTENIMSKAPSRSIASMPTPNGYFGPDFPGAYLQPRSQLVFHLLTKAEMADAFAPFKVDVGLESERAFDTRQIHAGAKPDSATKARAVPIYATAVRPSVAQC